MHHSYIDDMTRSETLAALTSLRNDDALDHAADAERAHGRRSVGAGADENLRKLLP
jgi:hypothetical protein